MDRINIYIETDSETPRSTERWTGYILECFRNGQAVTREHFEKRTGTYNETVLRTLIDAMKRINQPCEIHIVSRNSYVLSMIDRNLENWANREYRTAKGYLVKDHFHWAQLWKLIQGHMIICEPGENPYSSWMRGEMTRRKCS